MTRSLFPSLSKRALNLPNNIITLGRGNPASDVCDDVKTVYYGAN
jgi:hypothetical protein